MTWAVIWLCVFKKRGESHPINKFLPGNWKTKWKPKVISAGTLVYLAIDGVDWKEIVVGGHLSEFGHIGAGINPEHCIQVHCVNICHRCESWRKRIRIKGECDIVCHNRAAHRVKFHFPVLRSRPRIPKRCVGRKPGNARSTWIRDDTRVIIRDKSPITRQHLG